MVGDRPRLLGGSECADSCSRSDRNSKLPSSVRGKVEKLSTRISGLGSGSWDWVSLGSTPLGL